MSNLKTSAFGPIREARKLAFSESINKSRCITVELNEVGWIHIRQYVGVGGFLGHKDIYADLSLTTEDARNLIKCLKEFVPVSECEKKAADE